MNGNIGIRFGRTLTPWVKRLMIINGAVFLIQLIAGDAGRSIIETFGLSHKGFIQELKLWQIVTYMFLHGGWLHIFFNLFTLWMFACDLERLWGGERFIKYYMLCGMGAGVFIAAMNWYSYSQTGLAEPITIGASGAIYGILLAYGLMWPNRTVLIYFLFPVKMKYMLIGFGLLEFLGTFGGSGSGISHIGHLGGLVSGLALLKLVPQGRKKIKEKPLEDFLKQRRLKRKQKEIDDRIKAKNIIDELLEKIARNGMSSLTKEEKARLEWARKHYYPDENETFH